MEETEVQQAYEELKYLRRALRKNPGDTFIIQQIQAILEWLVS